MLNLPMTQRFRSVLDGKGIGQLTLLMYILVQEQVQHVRVSAYDIQKLTPQLLSAAEMAASQGDTSATMEHLNLLSQEWATKVGHHNVLMHCNLVHCNLNKHLSLVL